MNTRTFALVYGIIFLLAGAAGFVPAFVEPGAPAPSAAPETQDAHMAGVGLLFGLFPVNTLHNLVHLVFGIWGLFAATGERRAWIYAVFVAVVYLAFAIMGMASGLRTFFGLVPLYGHDIWLHLALFAGALVFAITGRGKLRQPLPPGATR